MNKRLITIIFMLMLSHTAFGANLFEPTSGDVSIKVLGAIFGGLLDSGGTGDPLINGIKAFNAGVLMIGGILAAYTIFSATVNTAHEGEVMGKSYSSAWLPIRYAIGTSIVLPIIGGGYCVMQSIVMWLVVQGIGLADNVWGSFMENPTSTANTKISTANRNEILDVAKIAFRNSICYRAFQQATSGDTDDTLGWKATYKYTMSNTDKGYTYGDSASSIRRNGCGEIFYPKILDNGNNTNTANSNTSTASNNTGYLGNIGTIFTPIDVSAINNAQKAQTDILVQSMDKLAGQVITEKEKVEKTGQQISVESAQKYYAQIESATDTYIANIKSTALSFGNTDAFSKMKASAKEQGWMLGGAWFTRIVQINQQVSDAVNLTPTGERKSPSAGFLGDGYLFKDASSYLQTADAVLNFSDEGSNDSFNTNPQNEDEKKGQSGDTTGFIKKAQGAILGVITGINLYDLKDDSRHPLIIVQDLGNRIEVACWSMMGIMASILAIGAGVLGPFSNSVIVGVDVMGWFVNVPIKLLMGVSYGASYILPNMPFIIWIGCITGWVLLVIEGVIAAPMWAIMHLHPGGQGFVSDRSANGYSLMLSLLLRPVLMIFGLMSALVISSVIGEFINKVYFEIFAQNTGSTNGWSALSGLAMGTLLYVILMFIFIRKCFGLMHQLPDQMLQWFGGQGSSLGQFAGEFASASDKGGAAASALGGATIGTIGGGLGKTAKGLEKVREAGGFNAFLAKNKGSQSAQGTQEQSSGESLTDMKEAQAQNNEQQQESVAQKTSSFPQPVQSFANKVNQMKTDEKGKQSFNLKNASASLPVIEKAINDIGADKTIIVAQDVMSKENKSLKDDMKEFSSKVSEIKNDMK
ncbi:DotA/TraY family protein [Burkholderia cenocepacia]